jgi:deazaflavin-dependent oxidoreductase (nitroreductase family)
MTEQNAPSELPSWIAEHIKLYLEDPEKGHDWDSTPAGGPGILHCLLLTTNGRYSGEPRTVPLIYHNVGNNFVVVASKGGAPEHPAWYLNLQSDPDCGLRVRHDEFRAIARTSYGEERDKLWEKMAEIYPPYNDYQAATGRKIPIVVLSVEG